ncbi:MAG: gluconokinase [Limisphaerales bacterium]
MILILMGVSGCGKTTIGKLLSCELGWEFHDGDDFHPVANVEKMKSGIPLNDEDRKPWLLTIREFMLKCIAGNKSVIIACSALKNSYREMLLAGHEQVAFIHLKGNKDLIAQRLQERKGHFMNPKLLDSQFNTLEEPTGAITIEVAESPEKIAAQIRQQLSI